MILTRCPETTGRISRLDKVAIYENKTTEGHEFLRENATLPRPAGSGHEWGRRRGLPHPRRECITGRPMRGQEMTMANTKSRFPDKDGSESLANKNAQ